MLQGEPHCGDRDQDQQQLWDDDIGEDAADEGLTLIDGLGQIELVQLLAVRVEEDEADRACLLTVVLPVAEQWPYLAVAIGQRATEIDGASEFVAVLVTDGVEHLVG